MIGNKALSDRARSPDAEHDVVQVTAADWVGRLSNSNVSLEDTLAWQEWMKADARHAEAFYRLEQISQALKGLAPPAAPTRTELLRDTYDGSLPLGDWKQTKARPRMFLAAAAAVALLIGAGVWMATILGTKPSSSPESALITEIGESRAERLSDGSTVTLGGATRVEWSFTQGERALELKAGEALFKVAKDAARPFKVRAGDATVVALGTEFNVRRGSDRTVIAVTDGRVVVEPVAGLLPVAVLREFKPKLRPVHLNAGEQTTADSAGIETASRMTDLAAATSWQTGRLSFRLQPLRYVLEDVNRYAKKPVVVDDDRIGALVVSGTVIGDNVAGWVESLEHAFGLTAVEEDERILLKAQ